MQITNPLAQQRFTEMRTAMLIHTPFFASLMLDSMDLQVGKFPAIQRAGTNGKLIWFDEDFLASLTLPEAVFVCCHEIGHAMFLHMDRFKRYSDLGFEGQPFNAGAANVAGDYIINAMLVDSQCGMMPKDCLYDTNIASGGDLFEEVYRKLTKDKNKGGKGGKGGNKQQPGGQPGNGQPPPGSNGQPNDDGFGGDKPLDTHVYEPSQQTEAEMKRAIASAKNQAKAMGKMPAGLERWVDEMLKPQVNWIDRLKHIVTRTISRSATTWTSPHRRRLVTQKIFMPSYTGYGAGTVVMEVDTSGSMGQREFDAAYSETGEILTTTRPQKLWLMSCDAAVHSIHELNGDCDIWSMKPELKGGGGTDFRPAFEKVEEMNINPDCLIFFTDGYGSFPDEPPPYPVIWVMTTDVKPPFGEYVQVDMSAYDN
jgi:predicted metal-dependent peptidase